MKYSILFLILYLLVISQSKKENQQEEKIIMNCYYSKTSGKYFTEISSQIDKDAIASATYTKSYETKGWDFLTISSYDKPDNK